MYIKIHQSYRTVVAVCDSDLIGKKFEEGKRILDIRESFYKGEDKSEKEIETLMIDLFKEDSTFNIIGKASVKAALKTGIIKKDGVLDIQGVPYALALL